MTEPKRILVAAEGPSARRLCAEVESRGARVAYDVRVAPPMAHTPGDVAATYLARAADCSALVADLSDTTAPHLHIAAIGVAISREVPVIMRSSDELLPRGGGLYAHALVKRVEGIADAVELALRFANGYAEDGRRFR